jgi:hypothetical protein
MVESYQKKLDIVNSMDWEKGKYYAIGDADEMDCAEIFQYVTAEDEEEYLVPESGPEEGDYLPLWSVVFEGCAIVKQN